MRKDLLLSMQHQFLLDYPLAFEDPEMKAIGKKHNVKKLQDFAKEAFQEERFVFIPEITEQMIKLVSRSSMVSMFEKPKFRDYVRALPLEDKTQLVDSLHERLYGNPEKGFNMMLDILIPGKLAKWSIMSVFTYYCKPTDNIFCKPTTVKNIIKTFELENLTYKPRPSYDFYVEFRRQLFEMEAICDSSLSKDHAAFTGFLMMSMPK